MPDKVQVRVSQVNYITRGEYNMVEIKGYDETNRQDFTKAFFAEKKGGGATANAQNAEQLKQDDWAEITMDDSSYHNVQSIRAIAAPANAGAGGQQQQQQQPHTAPAKKTGRAAGELNREVALTVAGGMFSGASKITKGVIDSLEKLAYRMEAFLVKGSFDSEVEEVPPVKEFVDGAPATPPPPPPPAPEAETSAPVDDDIPF